MSGQTLELVDERDYPRLLAFAAALNTQKRVWFSYLDAGGEVFTTGFTPGPESVITIPLEVKGDRDTVIKPLFLAVVDLLGESEMREKVLDTLRRHAIGYPLQSSKLKSTTAMKRVLKSLRHYLIQGKRCEILPSGDIWIAPFMLREREGKD